MSSSSAAQLRELLNGSGPLVVPFAYDALSARLIEDAGFQAVGVSGSAVSASLLAAPDMGLLSREEMVGQARRIAGAVPALPVIADAETGYGDLSQIAETVREFESAGVAALFMEDQQDPKRCGHLEGRQLVSADEMLEKLNVALEARRDSEFVVIGRTDALAVEGVEGAAARARAYLEAGADMAFVVAPRSREELQALPPLVKGPLMLVLSEGGVTPLLTVGELHEMGYKLIGYSGLAIGAAARSIQLGLQTLKEEGTTSSLAESVMPLLERNRLLGLQATEIKEDETSPQETSTRS
jgi:2-methylisocitrate lyase-like PEP mutase family enzyme